MNQSELNQYKTIRFDGIRYSIFMIEVAFQRLQQKLNVISESRDPGFYDYAEVFLDVWSIVDSGLRLLKLSHGLPGIDKNTSAFKNFSKSLEVLENPRHFIQHSDSQINNLITKQLPFWGYLTWCWTYGNGKHRLLTLQQGSLAGEVIPAVNPLGKRINIPVGLIELHGINFKLDLNNVVWSMVEFKKYLEQTLNLKKDFILPGTANDLLVSIDLDTTKK